MTAESDAVRAELAAATALAPAEATLERIVHAALNTPFPTPTEAKHRREHRMGRVPRIDADPELRTFVAARVDRRTFQEMADAVAAAFPPERRAGRSAIHAWWRRNRGRR